MSKFILAIDVGKINMGYALFNGAKLYYNLFNIDSHLINNINQEKQRTQILYGWFSDLTQKYDIYEMVIEQQVKMNIVAKSIQAILTTLAYIFNIKVKIYRANKKFLYNHETYDSKHKEHKRISEHYCVNICRHLGYTTDYFYSFKKKDDISDATCMAVFSFIEEHYKKDAEMLIKYLIN